MDYLWVKWLHIVSSTLLFGVGIGSAFYLLLASLGRDVRALAWVSRRVVWADWLFTATTVVIQPVTGFYLVHRLALPVSTGWVLWSTALYALAVLCWLPVVWLQYRMRDMAVQAAREGSALPRRYGRLLVTWVWLGSVAFVAFLAIFYLMVAKPM